MSHNNANEVVKEFFDSLKPKYQRNLEKSMKGTDFFLILFNWYIINVIKKTLKKILFFYILILQIGKTQNKQQ